MLNDHHGRDLEETFFRHRDRLHALALRIVGTDELAEDALQAAHEGIVSASLPSSASTPYEHCAQLVSSLAVVQRSLAQLPPRTRQAFTLYRAERLTKYQIAHRLQVSPTQVDAMIGDAVAALKACRSRIGSSEPL